MKRITLPALAAAAAVLLGACQGPPIRDSAQPAIAAGTGLGAATGALLGSLSGNFGWGALIGAAAGATGGYLYERGQPG
jgi:OmpA family protein